MVEFYICFAVQYPYINYLARFPDPLGKSVGEPDYQLPSPRGQLPPVLHPKDHFQL